ncbi:MAG TPA: gamma-glutamylcyclotransferase, partial [Reyranella sp.]|nr:gamma-glutamylcyclotransferase [Reyranella sp.]
VSDYQAIGVRCREVLLSLVAAAQIVMPWIGPGEKPQKANLKEWADHICEVGLAGQAQKDRRKLLKTLLTSTWDFDCWLAHTKSSTWHDAETACTTTEHVIGIWLSILIRHVRKVPEACPACGSRRLFPQRAFDPKEPSAEYERPVCDKCGWIGEATRITDVPMPPEPTRTPPEGDCVIPAVPLRRFRQKPAR